VKNFYLMRTCDLALGDVTLQRHLITFIASIFVLI